MLASSEAEVDMFLDVPALVVAFLSALLLSVRFRSRKQEEKATGRSLSELSSLSPETYL